MVIVGWAPGTCFQPSSFRSVSESVASWQEFVPLSNRTANASRADGSVGPTSPPPWWGQQGCGGSPDEGRRVRGSWSSPAMLLRHDRDLAAGAAGHVGGHLRIDRVPDEPYRPVPERHPDPARVRA